MLPLLSTKLFTAARPIRVDDGLPFWSQSIGNLPRCSDAMQNDVGLLPETCNADGRMDAEPRDHGWRSLKFGQSKKFHRHRAKMSASVAGEPS